MELENIYVEANLKLKKEKHRRIIKTMTTTTINDELYFLTKS
jgi:hypothetical protein